MQKNTALHNQPFIPVILGASIGVYSTARSFHEAYGVKSMSVSRALIGPIQHSVIFEHVLEPDMEQSDALLACLQEIAKTYTGVPKILIGSDDWHVEMIVGFRDQLKDEWIIPYTTSNTLYRVIDKHKFYNLCEELDVPFPKFINFDGKTAEGLQLPFDFPMVIKPTTRVTWEMVKFPGKKKVFTAQNQQQLEEIITMTRNGGYQDELIIQEFIPGDDTAMHILTMYTAQNGELQFASFGQTLLEDHTPGGIGNPLVIRTFRNDEVIEQAKRIVEHVGYTGFSNFDLKYDERDGKYKFFELNPRLGRSNYYISAGGHHAVRYYVKDYIEQESMPYMVSEKEALYTMVPKGLLLKYVKRSSLRDRVRALYRAGQAINPMYYFKVEKSLRRIFYVFVATFNFYRKFKKYPPL